MDVRTLTVLLLVTAALSGCFGGSEDAPVEAAPDPVVEPEAPRTPASANISWTPTEPVAGEPVTFSIEATGNVTSAFWTLGARTVLAAKPVHTFDAGVHPIEVSFRLDDEPRVLRDNLTVTGVETDDEDDEEETPAPPPFDPGPLELDLRLIRDRLVGSFDWGLTPQEVRWFFGDGTSSTQPDAVHAYRAPGTYDVVLVATAGPWSAEATETVTVEDIPLQFTIDRDGPHVELTPFWDQPGATYRWDFGDGTMATGAPVERTYNGGGPWTITLTATGGGTSEVVQQTLAIDDFPLETHVDVDLNRVAFDFTWGWPAAEVNATWSFGDGTVSHDDAPTHRYGRAGTYLASVQIQHGPYTASQDLIVEVVDMALGFAADLDANTVSFEPSWDRSWDTLRWDFGDGGRSTEEAPTHTYADVRPYSVRLTATSGPMTETVVRTVEVLHMPLQIVADVRPGNVAGLSLSWSHTADSVVWDFGDGSSGEGDPVQHVFPGKGTYTVRATAINDSLVARGVAAVSGEVDVDILFDGIPQFECAGEPVYEPHDTFGHGDDAIEDLTWLAAKDGQRTVITFTTAASINATFHIRNGTTWDTWEDAGSGTFHALFLDGRTIGSETCFFVTHGDVVSAKHVLVQENAMNRHEDGAYLTNLVMFGPSSILPDMVQQGTQRYADKLWDMTDGHMRSGMVLWIEDWLKYAEPADPGLASLPCEDPSPAQGTVANDQACDIPDVSYVEASRPGTAGTAPLMGIQQRHAAITMANSYRDSTDPALVHEFGSVLVHEFGHYGLGLSDRYYALPPLFPLVPLYSCDDPDHDISVMGISRDTTELDDAVHAPCPPFFLPGLGIDLVEQPVPGSPSWELFMDHYDQVPARTGLPDPGPTGDGGLFDIVLMDASGAPPPV